jgi:hypothetical protein
LRFPPKGFIAAIFAAGPGLLLNFFPSNLPDNLWQEEGKDEKRN